MRTLKSESGLQIANNQRVSLLCLRTNLWQKKRGNIERMIPKFHNSDFPIRIDTRDLNLPATEFMPKLWIEAIVAVELLCRLLLPISLKGMRAWCDFDRLSLTNKGAA